MSQPQFLDNSHRNRQRAGRRTLEILRKRELERELDKIAAFNQAVTKAKEELRSSATSEAAHDEKSDEEQVDKSWMMKEESKAGDELGSLAAAASSSAASSRGDPPVELQPEAASCSHDASAVPPDVANRPTPKPKRKRGKRAGKNVEYWNMAFALKHAFDGRQW